MKWTTGIEQIHTRPKFNVRCLMLSWLNYGYSQCFLVTHKDRTSQMFGEA